MPVPVSVTICGLGGLVAFSVTFSVPLRVPVAVGANVTLMMQLATAATRPPQEPLSSNSEAFVPLKARLERVN